MKVVVLAAAIAFVAVGCASADPTGDALNAKAADCIRGNASEVAAKASSLTDAVTFLTSDLCGLEIGHADAYAQSERTLAQWQATSSASQLAGVSIDPATGELKTPPTFSPPLNAGNMLLNVLRRANSQNDFTAMAAHAVLAARKPSEAH